MDIYEADTSGINSLGGFAYQLKCLHYICYQ